VVAAGADADGVERRLMAGAGLSVVSGVLVGSARRQPQPADRPHSDVATENAQAVARWFDKAGLTVRHTGEGAETWPVTTPEAALEWVQRSGAAASFKDAIDPAREQEVLVLVRDALARRAASTGGLTLTFVVVTGIKPIDREGRS
jgi:hypothetical protein